MIAALMVAAPENAALRYADLARSSANIRRTLPPQQFERLYEVCDGLACVDVTLQFATDSQGRPHVSGSAEARAEMPCHWCLLSRSSHLQAEFSALLAVDEAQARHWVAQDATLNVIVTNGAALNVADLIEDELLLGVTDRVCNDPACEHRPAAHYVGDDDAEQVSEATSADRADGPFAALADWKTKPGD